MNTTKITRLITFVGLLGLLMAPMMTMAAAGDVNWGINQINDTIGLGNEEPGIIVSRIINVVLGFLGIIAVVIILYGGFVWMTAAGNEEKVGTARKIIIAGIIGLAIVLAAWGIAKFVLQQLGNATGAPGL
ncbi:MAG: hypothetical protein V1692_02905 [bacterium]